MNPATAALALVAALCAGWGAAAHAAADPAATQAALRPLLAAADLPLHRAEGCQGDYGQRGRARLGDLLASQLAFMHEGGTNVVEGRCDGRRCELGIRRRAGEDVSSATISYRLIGGRVDPASLRCVMTP